MTEPPLTPAARRHIARMLRAVAPHADRLDRRFQSLVERFAKDRYEDAQVKALLAITPAAAARLGSVSRFLEKVDCNGRLLFKLGSDLDEVTSFLERFEVLLGPVLGGRFQPAREQLHLATIQALNDAFYDVRTAESKARFGLYRAAAEEERRRIGRELHDEAGQSLLFLRLELEMLERQAPAPLAARLRAAREVAEHTIEELRRIVAALSPAVLERLGLRAALRRMADRFHNLYPSEMQVRISGNCEALSPRKQEAIYRVAQEALQNVLKHSRATRVMVSLRAADRYVRLKVADNGQGFHPASVSHKPMSFGLAGMRDRAALIGGSLTIRSVPGKGATVVLELPGEEGAAAGHVENSGTLN